MKLPSNQAIRNLPSFALKATLLVTGQTVKKVHLPKYALFPQPDGIFTYVKIQSEKCRHTAEVPNHQQLHTPYEIQGMDPSKVYCQSGLGPLV